MDKFTITIEKRHVIAAVESVRAGSYNICKACTMAQALSERFPDFVSMGYSVAVFRDAEYVCMEAEDITRKNYSVDLRNGGDSRLIALLPKTLEFTKVKN